MLDGRTLGMLPLYTPIVWATMPRHFRFWLSFDTANNILCSISLLFHLRFLNIIYVCEGQMLDAFAMYLGLLLCLFRIFWGCHCFGFTSLDTIPFTCLSFRTYRHRIQLLANRLSPPPLMRYAPIFWLRAWPRLTLALIYIGIWWRLCLHAINIYFIFDFIIDHTSFIFDVFDA